MSSQTKSRYTYFECLKDSADDAWFDTVPHHWEVKKISHVVRMQSGDSIESSKIFPEGEYPVFGGNGSRGFTEDYNLSGHHVLVGRQGALCGNINYSVGKVWASEHAVIVYPLVELDVTWLGETLRAMNLNQYNVSAAQPGLSVSNITCLKLPYPPYAEQKKIANFLDHETAKIDTLIEKQQQLIKLLKEKRQAVISHAVTKGLNPDAPMKDSGVEWLGEVPVGWKICCIKHVVKSEKNSMVDGPFGSSVNTEVDYVDEGVPVVRTVNISNSGFSSDNLKFMRRIKYEELRRHAVFPGDVLFSKVGTIGNSCVLPETIPEAILSTTGSCKISVDEAECVSEFLVFCIQSMHAELMQIANSNVQPFLNMANIKNLKIPLPTVETQRHILNYLSIENRRFDIAVSKASESETLLFERRTALISAAVTGKIDVRNWQPPKLSTTTSIDV